jgi:hypothetical protein
LDLDDVLCDVADDKDRVSHMCLCEVLKGVWLSVCLRVRFCLCQGHVNCWF